MTEPGIRYHDRVFVAGYSSSGKSGVVNHLFTGLRNQKLLVDTKPEFSIPGVEPVRDVDGIDWEAPVIHFIATSEDLDEFDRLFAACMRRRNLTVAVHELADLCHDQPNKTPANVRKFIRRGNIFGDGLIGASQRPVGMPRISRTECQHVFYMVPELDGEDHRIVARLMQQNPAEASALLADAQEHGEHSFVWYDRRARVATICPPLPAGIRGRSIVHQRALG